MLTPGSNLLPQKRPNLDFQYFFKIAPGTFGAPDSDFRDLLDELFNLNTTPQNRKKNQILASYFSVRITVIYYITVMRTDKGQNIFSKQFTWDL